MNRDKKVGNNPRILTLTGLNLGADIGPLEYAEDIVVSSLIYEYKLVLDQPWVYF